MLSISQVSFYYGFISQGPNIENLNTNNSLPIKVTFLDKKSHKIGCILMEHKPLNRLLTCCKISRSYLQSYIPITHKERLVYLERLRSLFSNKEYNNA